MESNPEIERMLEQVEQQALRLPESKMPDVLLQRIRPSSDENDGERGLRRSNLELVVP